MWTKTASLTLKNGELNLNRKNYFHNVLLFLQLAKKQCKYTEHNGNPDMERKSEYQ